MNIPYDAGRLAATLLLAAAPVAAQAGGLILNIEDAGGSRLSGACFELWTAVGGEYGEKVREFCNVTGTSPWTLPEGDYVLHEYAPPSLKLFPDAPSEPHVYRKIADRVVSVPSTGTNEVTLVHDQGAAIEATAYLPDGSVAGTSCFVARGLVFSDGREAQGPLVDEACSGAGATATLYVGGGAYVVSQVSGPAGYGHAPDAHVDTVLDGRHALEMHMRTGGSIEVEQRAADGSLAPGGCYAVYTSPAGGPEAFWDYVCDRHDDDGQDGFVHVTDLQPGRYRLDEEEGPDGFRPVAEDVFVAVGAGVERVVRVHEPLPVVRVTTTDSGGAPVPGSCWRVHVADQPEGWIAEACDEDGDGVTVFATLTPGDYDLFHTDAPLGYDPVEGFTAFAMADADVDLVFALAGARAPVNTFPPTVAGAPRLGATLTGDKGEWDGTGPFGYQFQWQRCDDVGAACAAIAGARQTTYVPVDADVGRTLRFAATVSNVAGASTAVSAPTAPVGGAPANTALPRVLGVVTIGRALTGTDGTWTGAPTELARQWLRCDGRGESCAPIPGATTASYTPTQDDVGSSFRYLVTASNAFGATEARSLASSLLRAYPPVNEVPPSATLVTRWIVGGHVGRWVSGYGDITYAYQWLRCDLAGEACAPIPGATAIGYQIVDPDAPFTLRFQVSASNTNGTTTAVSAPTVNVGLRPPTLVIRPFIEGDLQVGETLSVVPGRWEFEGRIRFRYQWQWCDASGAVCEDIPGATRGKYRLSIQDAGHRIRVQVWGDNGQGETYADSVPTDVLELHPPVLVIRPFIEGDVRIGEDLTVVPGRWEFEGRIRFRYQWQWCDAAGENCADIPGATRGRYGISVQDAGHRLRVQVWGDNGQGSTYADSLPTAMVELRPPVLVIRPFIEGDARVGKQLSVVPGRWEFEGRIRFRYQWQSCDAAGEACADIPGATRGKYRLTAQDAGRRVRVQVWGHNGQGETYADSLPTAVVR